VNLQQLNDPKVRRSAMAARAATMAISLKELRAGSRELGVAYPARVTPTSLRRWAEDLQRANGTVEVAAPDREGDG
jgi:hypothetical protein